MSEFDKYSCQDCGYFPNHPSYNGICFQTDKEVHINTEICKLFLKREDIEREAPTLKQMLRVEPFKMGSFQVDRDGIHEELTAKDGKTYFNKICSTPCYIKEVGTNIDTGEQWLKLAYTNLKDIEQEEWIKLDSVLTRKGIAGLINKGLLFPESNTAKLNQFFYTFLSVKKTDLPELMVADRNGWKGEFEYFIAGSSAYNYRGHEDILHTNQNVKESVGRKGTLTGWMEAVREILVYPNARFSCYVGLSAPLLRILKQQSFIYDVYSESSDGKTTCNRIQNSMFGHPIRLEASANTTKVGAERIAEQYTDLPLNMDETSSTSTRNPELLQELVYMWSNERGKTRGNKQGTLQEAGSWKTVVMVTGEAPITTECSFTGAKIRVIEHRGGIREYIPEIMDKANDGILENYGHILPLYMKEIFERLPNLNRQYTEIIEEFEGEETKFNTRLIKTFGVIALAGVILEDIFEDIGIEQEDPVDLVKDVFEQVSSNRGVKKLSERALELVQSWVSSKQKYFIIEYEMEKDIDGKEQTVEEEERGRYEVHGWIVKKLKSKPTDPEEGFIDVIPHLLKKFLKDQSINPERVFEDWRDEEVIKCSPGRYTIIARHFKEIRVIRFNPQKLHLEL